MIVGVGGFCVVVVYLFVGEVGFFCYWFDVCVRLVFEVMYFEMFCFVKEIGEIEVGNIVFDDDIWINFF